MNHKPSSPKLPPVWLVKGLNGFRTFLLQLNRKMFPGNVVLYEQFQYFWLLPSLYVAAKLDIATTLKAAPLTATELAEQLHADPLNLSRIMRALASQGIFKQTRDGRYCLNAMSRALLEEEGSLRYMVLHHLGPVNWNLMSNLDYAVRTGKDAFTEKYGKPVYEYVKDHPAENELFDLSMTNLSDLGLAPVMQAYDFSKSSVIADIGGGEGFLLANILSQNPACRGILFDTTAALARAPEMLSRFQVEGRVSLVPGDFFSGIPFAADLYLMKNILHNWGDEACIRILENIRLNIKPNGQILIIEMVVPDGNAPALAKLLDIQMMATLNDGRERTAAEYRTLLKKAGFIPTRILPTIAPISLIEAAKNE